MQQEVELSALALAQEVDPTALAASVDAEWKSLLVMVGIWRPRMTRLPD
jgi:hypothetical protein